MGIGADELCQMSVQGASSEADESFFAWLSGDDVEQELREDLQNEACSLTEDLADCWEEAASVAFNSCMRIRNNMDLIGHGLNLAKRAIKDPDTGMHHLTSMYGFTDDSGTARAEGGMVKAWLTGSSPSVPKNRFDASDITDTRRWFGAEGDRSTREGRDGVFVDYSGDSATVKGVKDDANFVIDCLIYQLRYLNDMDYLQREYLENFANNPDIDQTEGMMGMTDSDGNTHRWPYNNSSPSNAHELMWVCVYGVTSVSKTGMSGINVGQAGPVIGERSQGMTNQLVEGIRTLAQPLFDMDGAEGNGSGNDFCNGGDPGGAWFEDGHRGYRNIMDLVGSVPLWHPSHATSYFSWSSGFGIGQIAERLQDIATRCRDAEMVEGILFVQLANDISAAAAEIAEDILILHYADDLVSHPEAESRGYQCGIRTRIEEFEDELDRIKEEDDEFGEEWLEVRDDDLIETIYDLEIHVDENYITAADLNAIDLRNNPKKVFYKEQCFLLSFMDTFVYQRKLSESRSVSAGGNTARESSSGDIWADAGIGEERAAEINDWAVNASIYGSGWRPGFAPYDRMLAAQGGSPPTESELSTLDSARSPFGEGAEALRNFGVQQRLQAQDGVHTQSGQPFSAKRYPYLPNPDNYWGNASVLVDGNPYAFVNRLTAHPDQKYFMNIKNDQLSYLQPKLRLYKVIYDEANDTESQIEVKFASHFDKHEMDQFQGRGMRSACVGVKSFEFTYDGSNPFSAKKSIKAKLVIFANTFDELLMCRDEGFGCVGGQLGTMQDPTLTYKYTDLAMKTFGPQENSDDESCSSIPWRMDIDRQNNELSKLNFRLKATVGVTVPNHPLFNRTDVGGSMSGLGAGLNANNVTLNLTPTIHNFDFDEFGRVTFTINYLAFVDDFYDSPAFNIFADPHISKRRFEREANYKAAEAACEGEDMDAIREQNAQMAGAEFRQTFQGLMNKMIARDKVKYLSIKNEDIIGFTSYGPYYSDQQDESGFNAADIEILHGEQYNESLEDQIDEAMDEMQERQDPEREAPENDVDDDVAIAAALMVESPSRQNLSFFYVSDLIDIILENIEDELDTLPDELDPDLSESGALEGLSASSASGLDSCVRREKAQEIRKMGRAFKHLRIVLGPVEIVPVREELETQFVNFGDIPISVKYFVEWMTMKFFSKSEYVYTLSKFIMDLMNNLVDQFLNSDKCFGYPARQSIIMNQAVITGHGEEGVTPGHPDEVMDSLTYHSLHQSWYAGGSRRLDLNNEGTGPEGSDDYVAGFDQDIPQPVIRVAGYDATSPRDDIDIRQEINYFIFFAGQVMPTDRMNGSKIQDEAAGIFHYMLGRDRGIVYDISLSKAATPGLAEVRFEQEGYDGMQQLRVVYDAKIETFANVNTFPGSYIYIEPYGFSPSAQGDVDLTQFGLGGYYMIIRSKHKFASGVAKSEIEAKWVNQIEAEGRSAGMERTAAEAKSRHACAAAAANGGYDLYVPEEEQEEMEEPPGMLEQVHNQFTAPSTPEWVTAAYRYTSPAGALMSYYYDD